MDVVHVISGLLSRSLTDSEFQALSHLSPQGLAKLNSDLIRGMPIDSTVQTFAKVYTALLNRRQKVAAGLTSRGEIAQTRLETELQKPLTTDELVYLNTRCPEDFYKAPFNHNGRIHKGIDFEERSEEYHDTSMSLEATRLAQMTHSSVIISRLAPTTTPLPGHITQPTCVRWSAANSRIYMGVSPICAWFDEFPQSPLFEVSPLAANLLLASKSPNKAEGDDGAPAASTTNSNERQSASSESLSDRNTTTSTTCTSRVRFGLVVAFDPLPWNDDEDEEEESEEETISASSGGMIPVVTPSSPIVLQMMPSVASGPGVGNPGGRTSAPTTAPPPPPSTLGKRSPPLAELLAPNTAAAAVTPATKSKPTSPPLSSANASPTRKRSLRDSISLKMQQFFSAWKTRGGGRSSSTRVLPILNSSSDTEGPSDEAEGDIRPSGSDDDAGLHVAAAAATVAAGGMSSGFRLKRADACNNKYSSSKKGEPHNPDRRCFSLSPTILQSREISSF